MLEGASGRRLYPGFGREGMYRSRIQEWGSVGNVGLMVVGHLG